MKKLTILAIIVDVAIAVCFFIFYGPFEYVKNLVISTAMVTKTHQYIAYTFYSEDTVKMVLEQNAYIPITDDVDLEDIKINNKIPTTFENEYEEAILKREKGDKYKYVPIKVGKYDAHLVAIYDPSHVEMITSPKFNSGSGAEKVTKMCERLGGLVCINGGMFADPDGWGSDIPQGYLIKDGKVIWSDRSNQENLIGFTKDNKLLLINATAEEAISKGMRDALQFGPFLIVNGNKMQYASKTGGYDRAARVAIAQRKDGVVLFLVTEGVHTNGPNLKEITDTLELYGAYNAANLDGGSSAQLVIDNKLINNPMNVLGKKITGGRSVVSGFGLID
ncbi:MAG: phosphodiester glycosidase family protein [Bacilli bacterium]|nr:phosphodiester glycosidase family protein [Bacilli bacterium]